MTNKLSIFILILIVSLILSVTLSFADSEVVVFAEPCLNIRENAHNSSKIVGCIPFFSIINVSPNLDDAEDQYNRIDAGKWYSINYKGRKGYALGEYLVDARYFPVVKAGKYNNDVRILLEGEDCVEVNYSPELNWYGVYPTEKENQQELKRVKITIKTPNTFIKEKKTLNEANDIGDNDFFIVETDVKKKSLFLIGIRNPLSEGMINGFHKFEYIDSSPYQYYAVDREKAEFLYPEQIKFLEVSNCLPLFVKAKAAAYIDDPKKLTRKKRYEIEIAKDSSCFSSSKSQNLTMDIPEVYKTSYYEDRDDKILAHAAYKNPLLAWYGDIDQDKKVDLLFFSHNMAEGGGIAFYLTMFLSSKAEGHNYVKKVAELWYGRAN
ncbi:MAG: SH3 domain-containing protein [Syntrophaceae bacterium]|nr:SH3 domain-containing protein [Syntrophaceae bacterium]